MLYEYLKENYGENTPIYIARLKIEGMSENTLRQQIKRLTDAGLLKRYDTGIYFIPQKSVFKSGSTLSVEQVLNDKYLREGEKRCGYQSGILFANQLGLTTQIPMLYEIVTNKASREYREITIAKTRVILRRPRTEINEDNFRALQFLDLIKDVDQISELEGKRLTERLLAYMRACPLYFDDLEPFLPLYPDKLFRNLYEGGLMDGIPAQKQRTV